MSSGGEEPGIIAAGMLFGYSCCEELPRRQKMLVDYGNLGERICSAVLFDMDGVLMNTNPFHRCAWRRFCRELGKEITEVELKNKVFGWRTEEGICNLWGGSVDDAQVARLARRKEEIYREIVAPRIKPVRGLKEFVSQLRRVQLPTALATSACEENVNLLLGGLGMQECFQTRVLAAEVGRGKPDPRIFLVAAQRLDARPEECMVVEDSLSGVRAARRAGMVCVALTTTDRAAELRAAGASLVCRDFASRPLLGLIGPRLDKVG